MTRTRRTTVDATLLRIINSALRACKLRYWLRDGSEGRRQAPARRKNQTKRLLRFDTTSALRDFEASVAHHSYHDAPASRKDQRRDDGFGGRTLPCHIISRGRHEARDRLAISLYGPNNKTQPTGTGEGPNCLHSIADCQLAAVLVNFLASLTRLVSPQPCPRHGLVPVPWQPLARLDG